MKKLIVILVILVFVGLAGWQIYNTIKSRQEAIQDTDESTRPVVIQTIKGDTIQEDLSLVGNLVAASEVTVFPEVPGKLTNIYVDEGSKMKKGDVMAKIEDKELKLQVKQAEASVAAAKVGLDQARSLSEVKVRAQIAQAQAGFSSAQAALKQVKDLAEKRTRSQLEQAEAGLEALKANLKKIKEGAREEEKRQIEATVQQAKAGLDNAKADLERIENLYAEGAVSKQTLDATRTGATVAEAQYEAAVQQLKLVETGAREEDILAMESQVRQAEAGLEIARSMAETRSWEKDIEMARAGYEQAKAALESAKALEDAKSWEAEITGAETGLEQAQVALELAREMLSNATITAPISGVVSKRFSDEGAMAAPGAPLFMMVNMDKVKAVVEITEANTADVSQNSTAYISVESLPGEEIKGQVNMVSPTINSVSRTATAEIIIDNPTHRLKPGMFAKVTIPIDTHENAVVVPRSSVIEDRISGKRHLFVVNGSASSKREIEIGIAKSDKMEVLSGVKIGDRLVISGQHYLKDGESVQVVRVLD